VMPFYEDVGINLEGDAPQKIRINWKTGGVVLERSLGPLSVRHARHDATGTHHRIRRNIHACEYYSNVYMYCYRYVYSHCYIRK
jgi:hypothetical protein